jgi:hypothetical protein
MKNFEYSRKRLTKIQSLKYKYANCINNNVIDNSIVNGNIQIPSNDYEDLINTAINEIIFVQNYNLQLFLCDTILPILEKVEISNNEKINDEIQDIFKNKKIMKPKLLDVGKMFGNINDNINNNNEIKEDEHIFNDTNNLIGYICHRERHYVTLNDLNHKLKLDKFIVLKNISIDRLMNKLDDSNTTIEENNNFPNELIIQKNSLFRIYNPFLKSKLSICNFIKWFNISCDNNIITKMAELRNNLIINSALLRFFKYMVHRLLKGCSTAFVWLHMVCCNRSASFYFSNQNNGCQIYQCIVT